MRIRAKKTALFFLLTVNTICSLAAYYHDFGFTFAGAVVITALAATCFWGMTE